MRQDQPFNQQILLDKVSVLLKGFRTILKTVQDIARGMAADDDYTHHLKQLVVATTQLQQSARSIDYALPTNSEIESIFVRFINRLGEHILNVSKPSSSYNGSQLIDKLMNKLQEGLKTVKISRNIGAFFSNIFSIFKQFTLVAERLYYAEPITQDGIFVQSNITNLQNNQKLSQDLATTQPQPPKQSQYQKVMSVLNGYYSSLSCLDIDFSTFKTFYFQTRSQTQQQLIEQLTQRNGIIIKALAHYNKRFQEYQRKKQKNQLRKIKLISLQDIQPTLTPTPYTRQRHSIIANYKKRQADRKENFSQKQTQKQELKVHNKNPQKAQENQEIQRMEDYKQQSKELENQNINKKKTSYHIKNVYLTFRRPIRFEKDSYYNNLSQMSSVYRPLDLSKTIEDNEIEKNEIKLNQKHIKLSPVKIGAFAQPMMKEYLQDIQTHKATMIGIGKPYGVIHNLNKQKNKDLQTRPIRASSFARKLSKEFRFRGHDKIFKTLERPSPSPLNIDITL